MNLARRRQLIALLLVVTLTPLLIWLVLWSLNIVPTGEEQQPLFKLSDRLAALHPVEQDDGQWMLQFETQGEPVQISADEFIGRIAQRKTYSTGRSLLFRLLDITAWTGLLWVGLGFLGQVLFSGRMIVQWLVSEKNKRSIVPNAFWWMSLAGASMLIVYFTWRVDIVGVLGQATGWFIYIRNIWLIYTRPAESDSLEPNPAKPPEPAQDEPHRSLNQSEAEHVET